MDIAVFGLAMLRRVSARIGPYVAVELLLPGGTLLALLLYLYRRQVGLKNLAGRMSIRRPVKRLSGNGDASRARSGCDFQLKYKELRKCVS